MENTVTYKNQTLTLTQEPYMSGVDNDQYYQAHATDTDSNDYIVKWDILSDVDDESDCCDWNDYIVKKL